ncbi:reverse transcriptase domain-containing protein [Acanthopleuribacter pedis]|uniref:Reverse transcriptase domain-containing protein n=1 Tax=Acanthopleuribacter pedis TaxID=442870 RepID=A0A8J7U6G2_9BACT|nr:reverse transcriptase domain-containing protein [Acanthopleuribacter pedis]MBO1320331.1 hypothetical protein [Acanthopleuribacter pedis]
MGPTDFFLLRLDWEVLKPILRVPHFQGMLWSALFRHAYNPWLKNGESFHHTGLVLEPADFGVAEYAPGDRIALGLLVPVPEAERLFQVLSGLDQAPGIHGQFAPGHTVRLRHITCRFSGAPWPGPNTQPLGLADLRPLVEHYRQEEELKLWFHAPLRLTKPPHCKNGGRYCGPTFFQEHPLADAHLTRALGLEAGVTLVREACHGLWLDTAYGRGTQKIIGGFCGVLTMRRPASDTDLLRLITASFSGIGKNRGFGLGVFNLEKRDHLLDLVPLIKQRPLLSALLDCDGLGTTLETLFDEDIWLDGITSVDLHLAGNSTLDNLCAAVQEGRYRPGEGTMSHDDEADGREGGIPFGEGVDRLLQKRAVALLAPGINPFLSESCFAFRKGFGRPRALTTLRAAIASGYRYGITAEIDTLFGAVDRPRLWSLLRTLFPREPLLDLLACWLAPKPGEQGLPRNNPLSPILSNLYLEAFETRLQRRGLKLIRYASTMVVLCRKPLPAGRLQTWIAEALKPLKLTLAENKTQTIHPGRELVFLGRPIINGHGGERCNQPDVVRC